MKHVMPGLTVAAVLGATMASVAHGANDGPACEKEWLARSAEYTLRQQPDYAGLLEQWKRLEPRCRGTVAYEARLAFIYFFLNQPAKAREAINSVAGVRSAYDDLIEFAAISLEMNELLLADQMDEAHLHQLEDKLVSYLRRYPNMTAAHALLGTVKVGFGDHESAIGEFKAGLATDDPTSHKWALWRHLTVSYTAIGRYPDALSAATSALKLNPAVTWDREFMYALAISQTQFGMFDEAQTTLKLTLSRFPEVKQDPRFNAAVRLVYDKLQQKKRAGNP